MKNRHPTSKKTTMFKDRHAQKDDFRMIFEGPKMMKHYVFLDTLFFYKKNVFFTDRTHSQAFSLLLEGRGQFWRVRDISKIDKNWVWRADK